MGKLLVQFALMTASFFGMWYLVDQLDWMHIMQVEKVSDNLEDKLGQAYWDLFKKTEQEVPDHEIVSKVDRLLTRMCDANDIDRDQIQLHIVKSEQVNAFALPGGHIILFTGLISDSDTEAELAGVLAHEVAHLQLGHLMKKLVKEIGLSMLISMTSGNGNPEMIRQALKVVTSSAYDRSLESEADLQAVDYLTKSNINPEGLANFLYRMSTRESELQQQLFWISTHPGGEERSKDILGHMQRSPVDGQPVLTSEEWDALQQAVSQLSS